MPTMRHRLMLGSRIYCYKIKFMYTCTHAWNIHFVARFVISGMMGEREYTSAFVDTVGTSCNKNHTKHTHMLCSFQFDSIRINRKHSQLLQLAIHKSMASILLNVTHWKIMSVLHSFYSMEWNNDTRIR